MCGHSSSNRLSDGKMTEVGGPEVKEGMEVVVGDNTETVNPFKPDEPNKPVEPKSIKRTAQPPVETDEQAIQGTWDVVSSTLSLLKKLPGEKDISADQIQKTTKVIITDDTLKIVGEHVTDFAFEYRLNPNAKTKMIDLQTYGDLYGLLSYGIYSLDENQLKIFASPLSFIFSNSNEPPEARIRRPAISGPNWVPARNYSFYKGLERQLSVKMKKTYKGIGMLKAFLKKCRILALK